MWREKALNIWGKVLNTLPKDETKEIFLDEIEQIENDDNFKKMKKYRDNLDEDKKLKYYNDWEVISVKWSVKWSTRWPLTPTISPTNPLKIKIDVKDNLYVMASPLIRLWVSFWLLDAPKKLEEKELLKNIKKDARRLRRNLWIFEKVCAVVPQLKAAAPIVKAIRPYAKRYEKNGAPLMQERIKEQNAEKAREAVDKQSEMAEQAIAKTLTTSEENILETNVKENNAA